MFKASKGKSFTLIGTSKFNGKHSGHVSKFVSRVQNQGSKLKIFCLLLLKGLHIANMKIYNKNLNFHFCYAQFL